MIELANALKLMRKHVFLPLGRNSHYKQHHFFWLLATTSCLNWFAEGVSNYFSLLFPQADDLFHHVKKMSVEQVQEMFGELTRENVKQAKRLGLLGKPVWLAVDWSGDAFYGEPNSFTRGGKEKAGTNYFYTYLAASVVVNGQRFVIAVLPFTPLDSLDELLEKLLNECRALVRIKCLLLDRGFYSSNVLRLLESKRLNYVMPVVSNSKLEKTKEGVTVFPKTVDYSLNGFPTRLVFVKDGENTLVFCTNYRCERNKLTDYYGWRWGIETGYRVTDGLQAKTCSASFVVRVFLAYFAIALYNALQLAKANAVNTRSVAAGKRLPTALALVLLVLSRAFNAFFEAGLDPPVLS